MIALINLVASFGAIFVISLILSSAPVKTYLRSVLVVIRLPGPLAWPIIGNAHWAVNIEKLKRAAVECPQRYGLIIRAWISFYPVVFILDPVHIKKILSNVKHCEKPVFYKMMENFLGAGLITSDVFMEELITVFNKGGQFLASMMETAAKTGEEQINIIPLVNKTIFNVLTEAVLGVKMESREAAEIERDSPYRKGSSALLKRMLRPWLLFPTIFGVTNVARKENMQKKALKEFTMEVLQKRKTLMKITQTPECFADHLLKIVQTNPQPQHFTDDDCVHEACTLMLAGQDSVGGALAFALHLLANNAMQQARARSEQIEIFGTSDRPCTYDDLKEMQYLEQCIRETLRLYPSVPIIGRTLGQDLKLGKTLLPKGCDVFISPYATHRLPDIFPDPEVFNPDRFHPDAVEKLPSHSFLAFSAGPRNCIGYKLAEIEMKTILSSILRRFCLAPVKGKEDVKISFKITLRASGGLWVNVKLANQP